MAPRFSDAKLSGCALGMGSDVPEAELRALSAAAPAQLRDGLLRHGVAPGTPAGVIEKGGTHLQRELHGTPNRGP